MAENHYRPFTRPLLDRRQQLRHGAQRRQFRALDARKSELDGFPHIHQVHLLSGIELLLHLARADLKRQHDWIRNPPLILIVGDGTRIPRLPGRLEGQLWL